MTSEQSRVSQASEFYLHDQLDIDKTIIRYRYQTLRPFFRGPRCLELGPADGWMTREMVKDFEALTVVDGSPELLAVIPPAPNLTKVHCLFEDFVCPEPRFNTILLEHILEHVEDPVALMARARAWAAEDRVFLMGVPNANSLHRLAGVKMGLLERPDQLNARDLSQGHRRVYSLETFRADIEKAGLTVVEMGGVFLKPLAFGQIQAHWTPAMIEAFYALGKDFPSLAGDIYAVCR